MMLKENFKNQKSTRQDNHVKQGDIHVNDRKTWTSTKTRGEIRCSGMVN